VEKAEEAEWAREEQMISPSDDVEALGIKRGVVSWI
jgi:hypothetical protein